VQIRQLSLKQQVVVIGSAYIARATCACTAAPDSLLHRGNHRGMLTHAQVIVGTPNRNIPSTALKMIGGLRKLTGFPFKIGEIPIIAILFQLLKLIFEKLIKRHGVFFLLVQLMQRRMTRPLALLPVVYRLGASYFCTYRQVLIELPATFPPP
jgi:hypothetical protein